MSAWIRKRKYPPSKKHAKGHTSRIVLYRRQPGRSCKQESLGTFAREKDAKARCNLVNGWLALGKDPKVELAAMLGPSEPVLLYEDWFDRMLVSRHDLSHNTKKGKKSHRAALVRIFGGRDPFTFTIADQIEGVAKLAEHRAPGTVVAYWSTHCQLFDFAEVRPNTARDEKVKMPRQDKEEIAPPPADHVLVILQMMSTKWRLPLVVAEQCGMSDMELELLEWRDVDVKGCRFRLRQEAVKGRIRARARWIYLPPWLMAIVCDGCPTNDRSARRRVFPGFTGAKACDHMERACIAGEIPQYRPHDLRHRRISIWQTKFPPRQLAVLAGHSKASMSLDKYSHVMPIDEVPPRCVVALLAPDSRVEELDELGIIVDGWLPPLAKW